MSTCYKNFPVVINYADGTNEVVYGNTINLSESVPLEHADSLGVKGSSTVFNTQASQGSISIDSYMTGDVSKSLSLIESNTQQLTINLGPYKTPSPCVLSSFSVNVVIGEPLVISREYQYHGSIITTSTPSVAAPTVVPIVPEGVSISGYSAIGGSNIITDISWSVSQSYQQFNLLGNVTPVMVYSQGEKTLDINGEGFTEDLMKSSSAGCVVPPKNYSVIISGCGQELGTLSISGYMSSRSSEISVGEVERNSVSIIQYL